MRLAAARLLVTLSVPPLAAQAPGTGLELQLGVARAYHTNANIFAASVTVPIISSNSLTGRLLLDASYLTSDLASALNVPDRRHLVSATAGFRLQINAAARFGPFVEFRGGIAHAHNTDEATTVGGAAAVTPLNPEDGPGRRATGAVFGGDIGAHFRFSRTVALMIEGRLEQQHVYPFATTRGVRALLAGLHFSAW